MTRTLEDTADERARLANMALADCGLPEVIWAGRSVVTGGRAVGVVRHTDRDYHVAPWSREALKAIGLATMRILGPDVAVPCNACVIASSARDCERIPVADALRGMTCGKHGGTT